MGVVGGEAPSVYRVARTEKEGSDKRKSVIEILEKKDGRRKVVGILIMRARGGGGGRKECMETGTSKQHNYKDTIIFHNAPKLFVLQMVSCKTEVC